MVQFILGHDQHTLNEWAINEIQKKLAEQPKGHPIILLVPDQMSYLMEYQLATRQTKGMIRTQVYSFSRLAYRVLQEVGGISRIHLDQVGINMLLRKIVEQRKEELKVYRRSADQHGFYIHLEQMITELKRYCIGTEELGRVSKAGNHPLIGDKLHDLQLIYRDFERQIDGKYIDAEDYLRLLTEKIPHSKYLRQAEIYVLGFHQFTPQEYEVLSALFKQSKHSYLLLLLPAELRRKKLDVTDLFYTTARTYHTLKELVNEQFLTYETQTIQSVVQNCSETETTGSNHSLRDLRDRYDSRPLIPYQGNPQITLTQAVNRRAEVEHAARQIISLVRDHHYRWRDIAVITRDVEAYRDLLYNIFEDYEIPVFIDQKRSMLHHPLIELVRSALEVITYGWRYEAIFRCAKSDLLLDWQTEEELECQRDKLDRFENVVLALGINGKRWLEDELWRFALRTNMEVDEQSDSLRMEHEQELEDLRQQIVKPLQRLEERLSHANTLTDLCTELFLFLEDLRVPEKIEHWRKRAEENGKLQEAQEHDQVWNALIHLFEQMVELNGEEKLSIPLFQKLIESGCETLQFSLVPPALDQVLVGDMERSRFVQIKCALLLGLNDGILPKKERGDGFLTEDEREILSDEIPLLNTKEVQLSQENFYFYLSLCTGQEKLMLSYSLADDEGKALTPSPFLRSIKELFPDLEERFSVLEPYEAKDAHEYIVKPARTLTFLGLSFRQWLKGYPLPDLWWDVYNWFVSRNDWKERLKHQLKGLYYYNQAVRLSSQTSRRLYGETIRTSVSRMEKYQSCPYAHYLSYGLRLKERETFKLEAPDIGQLFHAALKLIDDGLKDRGMSWRSLDDQECKTWAEDIVKKLAPRMQGNILYSTKRYRYIKRKLQQVVERAVLVLRDHASHSQFVPVGMEIGFGPGDELPPLRLVLADGTKMEVVGRIDRVDRAEGTQELWLRVIDFKSSYRDVDLSDLYFGLSLQMLAYLDVILTYSERWLGQKAHPAGILYFHVHNPFLQISGQSSAVEVEEERTKKFKMRGLVLANEQVVRLMDTTIEKSSIQVPVEFKKDGQFSSRSSIVSEEDFDLLRQYVRGKMKEIGENMIAGKIDIEPFKRKDKTACTFCAFRPICQYDTSLAENQYNDYPSYSRKEVLEALRQKINTNRIGGTIHA